MLARPVRSCLVRSLLLALLLTTLPSANAGAAPGTRTAGVDVPVGAKLVFVAGDTATAKRFFEKLAKPVWLAGFELGPTTPFAAWKVNVLATGPASGPCEPSAK